MARRQEIKANSKIRRSKYRTMWSLNAASIVLIVFISVQSTDSSLVKGRKYVVKSHFQGLPKRSDFEIVEYELPSLREGEILVKAEWISVDPYLRLYNPEIPVPYDQFSFQVGTVEESKDQNYPVGSKVVTHMGWRDYSVVNTTEVSVSQPAKITWMVPDLKGRSPSIAIGTVGLPGITAYYGMTEVLQPKKGETIVVTGAAGAIGSIAGQIAKMKGSKVIGFAGSDKKVKWLENELGFDKAINYKTADIVKALREAAPNGVDGYFDNVGGELSSIIMSQMNNRGRVAACGSVSSYNDEPLPKATVLQPFIVFKELRVQGFVVMNWLQHLSEAVSQMTNMVNSGLLKPTETVTVGFDKLFDAFVGVFAGDNFGKAIVKV